MEEKGFRLANYCKPALEEGNYTINGLQKVTRPAEDHFSAADEFYVAANSQMLSQDQLFTVYPAPEQQGDFAGTLPFIVLNQRDYPWIRHWTEDVDGLPVPWVALIVLSEEEEAEETDAAYSELAGKKEEGVFFPYQPDQAACCREDDTFHLLTISRETYHAVMPAKEDLAWLTHAKFVDLSAAEDSVAQQDGWFSTVIGNRFIPSSKGKQLKSTIHFVAVDGYLDESIPQSCNKVRFISLYHWSVYSETEEDKSFVTLINGLSRNTGSVKEKALKPHYLRTGEKTYSFYASPLLPSPSARYENINGEEKYTADGRLIYDCENGIFDVSYSAAFNLGRLITLSRRSEAEKIAAWRKSSVVKRHLNSLESAMSLSLFDLEELTIRLAEGKRL